jgi:hypothetical protein
MIAGKAALLGLGFVFWLFAARLFPAAAVGLAGGAVSAIMLCVQVAILGVGAALVIAYPKAEADPAALLDSAITVVTLAAATVGALFLVVAGAAFDELRVVAMVPSFAVLFVVMSVSGTIVLLFDHMSMAQSKGFDVFTRNGANAVITIAPLALVPLLGTGSGGLALFAAWVAGSLAACGLGFVQLHRTLGYRYRPRLDRRLGAALVRRGLPNQALTLAERAPALILPILVTELLSAADNAYWYTAWMMAWTVNVIPLSVGMALFAETAHRPDAVDSHVRRSLSAVSRSACPRHARLRCWRPGSCRSWGQTMYCAGPRRCGSLSSPCFPPVCSMRTTLSAVRAGTCLRRSRLVRSAPRSRSPARCSPREARGWPGWRPGGSPCSTCSVSGPLAGSGR